MLVAAAILMFTPILLLIVFVAVGEWLDRRWTRSSEGRLIRMRADWEREATLHLYSTRRPNVTVHPMKAPAQRQAGGRATQRSSNSHEHHPEV